MTLLNLEKLELPGGTTVSLTVAPGETVGIVGEPGSVGEDLVSLLLGQIRPPGEAVFDGTDLRRAGRRGFEEVRRRTGILRDNGHAPLNPRRRIRAALEEPLGVFFPKLDRAARDEKIDRALMASGADAAWLSQKPIGLPRDAIQSISLARALVCVPDLLLAIDPFRGLELEDRARLANRFLALRENGAPGVILVCGFPELALHLCDNIVVLQGGQCVETGTAADIRVIPRHAYTQQLVNAIPEPIGGAFDLRVLGVPR